MEFYQGWASLATAGFLVLAVWLFLIKRRVTKWAPPVFDPKRYQVVMHYAGETRELFSGLEPVQARRAYEEAPIQPGVVVEFYEFGKCRGKREAK